jgi:hypothetical protein
MADSLKPLVAQWLAKIQLAWECKKKEFQDSADECMRMLDGPYDWLYKPRNNSSQSFDVDDMEMKAPSVRITINKTAELVQLFGPAIYHRNPIRRVNPREIVQPPQSMFGDVQNDPMAAQAAQMYMNQFSQMTEQDVTRAQLMEKYLNYTPTALNLKTHSRWAMTEALIKGAGLLWTELHSPAGSTQKWVGSFFDTVDNLQMDPDAEVMTDVKWVARRCCHPVWEVEQKYGLPPGSLKATTGMESYTATASVNASPDEEYRRKQGRTADLLVYYKIYSKMGMGGRLHGIPESQKQLFDMVGNYVYLVVADGVPYPLNLPPPLCDAFNADDPMMLQQLLPTIQQRLQWETPFWADNAWPFTMLAFHFKPRQLWPLSHLKPGMGELLFLNWAWSFLAAKVRIASRDFLAIAQSAGEEIKNKIKHGADYTVIEIQNIQGSIDKVVQFLQHPGFNPEIYKVIAAVTEQFDRRVGLTELMYGMSARQMRSAQEAQIKSDAINVRPDDMANSAEDAMTESARREAFAARWHLTGADVAAPLGPVGAQMWDALMVNSDPSSILYSLEYRIEANSARKPNKAQEAENMQQAVQNLFQPLFGYAQTTGDVNPINALITDWAKSIDLHAESYLLQPPPPPPPPMPPEGEAPPPEGPPPEAAPM